MKTSLLTMLTLVVCLNFQTSLAQDLDTVTITGRVVDQNGAVIPGAEISATLIKPSAVRTINTNDSGTYKLIQLEPGTYVLRASARGFASQELASLTLASGRTQSVDFTLVPAELKTETVVITAADAPLLDTRKTTVGATMNARETQLLPIPSRSALDLVFTLPGVTEEPLSTRDLADDRNTVSNATPEEAGNFSLAGSPAYSNNLTIDGLDNNDDRAAQERFQPPLDAIEEVQVIVNQFSAEYGRASGGRVNLRTRSGSNEFHGRAFYFFRDEALDANTFKNNSLGLKRLPFQNHVAGFTFGGPLKVLPPTFFVAYESSRILDSALIDTLVPVDQNPLFPLPAPSNLSRQRLEETDQPGFAAAVAPFVTSINTPSKTTSLTARVDHQVSALRNISFVYQRGRLTNLRQFGGGNRLAESLVGKKHDSEALSISDSYVLNANLVNQLRFQFSRLSPGFKANSAKPVVLIALKDSFSEGDSERRTGTLVAGSSTSGSSDRREVRFQVQEILSLLTATHSLKFGADIQRVRSEFIDLADTTGTYNFASASDFLANLPTRFRQTFDTTSTKRNSYFGFFVQDEWQVLPQLLLSYGLRYEHETIVDDWNNFGPRISLAYNPLASGKFVIRAGGGSFYNRPLLRTIDDFALGKQQLFFDTSTLSDPLTLKLMSSEQRREFIATNLRFPETLDASSVLVRQFGALNKNFSRQLDGELRIPESYQLNVGAERDLGGGFALESNLTWTRGVHLWREFNVNAPRLPGNYQNFTSYLASRDFANFRDASSNRPLYNVSTAGELVRFVFQTAASNPNTVSRVVELGVPVSVFNLNSPTSTTALEVARAALNKLRRDPTRAEVEQLISAGNSFYRGVTVELRRRFISSDQNFKFTFRSGYTFSKLVDDGIVNTSDALVPGDFYAERARSLMDRRHRFVFSGVFDLPGFLGALELAPIWRIASGAPFNISIGGTDRNLDDVGNDRPNFNGDLKLLRWRDPGNIVSDVAVVNSFSLPAIGQSGNLPRNAGVGPGQFLLDLNVAREFRLSERTSLRALIEFDNVLNKTVFSFGSEFINFNALSPTATAEQRQAFLDAFLVATRTMRPRQIRVGLKFSF